MKEKLLKIILKIVFLIKINIIVKLEFILLLIDQQLVQILQIKNQYFLILLKNQFLLLIKIILIL